MFACHVSSIESIKKKGVEWVKDLGRKNVEDMLEIIEWNERNVSQMIVIDVLMYSSPQHIRFMRMYEESAVGGAFDE